VIKRILAPVKYRRNRGGNMTRRFLLAAAFGLALCASAHAQDYPARPIRIVVPYPAGGSADLLPRIFAEKLGAKWGQAVLVENRPGAGGNIGAEFVYKADPDGYTLFATAPGPLVVNKNLFRKLAFDPSEFVPVSAMAAINNVLLVNPRVPARAVDELIAYATANPGKLNYGSQGNGTTSHLTAELFKSMAGGLKITHIPYKGSAPGMAALLAGEIDLMFDNLGVTLQHVKSGKLRALAVCSEKRVASLPDVPAMSEILPGFSSVAWFGIVAPPKTPAHGESALDSAKAAIDAALAGEVDAVVAAPQTESSIKLAGIEFDGYPTFVARCTGVPPDDAFLMICFDSGGTEMRIAHATLHASLRRAIKLLTRERVLHAVRSADSALRRMGFAAPRIAVSGLNPHAGEGGLFGDEEVEIIGPAIADAKKNGVAAEGPFGADTMFLKKGYDAFVVMVHDQGHIMAKTHAFAGTAALTIGTPVLFSSVAHGSALDIAGKNRADPGAMISAIRRVAGASTGKREI